MKLKAFLLKLECLVAAMALRIFLSRVPMAAQLMSSLGLILAIVTYLVLRDGPRLMQTLSVFSTTFVVSGLVNLACIEMIKLRINRSNKPQPNEHEHRD